MERHTVGEETERKKQTGRDGREGQKKKIKREKERERERQTEMIQRGEKKRGRDRGEETEGRDIGELEIMPQRKRGRGKEPEGKRQREEPEDKI